MSYKVVKTIENNKMFLTAVPHLWEKNNILLWPNANKNVVEKLRRNVNSAPQPDWMQIACTMKRLNIETFSDALQIEKEYCELTDTDAEEMFNSLCNKRKIRRMPISDPTFRDYNDSIDSLNYIAERNEDIFVTETICEEYPSVQNIINEIAVNTQKENNPSPCTLANNEAIITFTHLEKIPEIQRRLEVIEGELAKQNTKIDKCLNILQNIAEKLLLSTEDITQRKEENDKFNFPISTVEDLNNFDKALLENDYKKKMLAKFKSIGGTSGHENGRLVAYKLIDALVKRDVLKNFTWTGVSKSSVKLSFSALKEINVFFTELVRYADNRFSAVENENFFKNAILKHSIARAQPRNSMRQSTPRSSTKRNKCVTISENESSTDNTKCSELPVDETLNDIETITDF